MREPLILLVVVGVIAMIWYLRREHAKLHVQPKSVGRARLADEATASEHSTIAGPVGRSETGAAGRGDKGAALIQDAAASAAGARYLRAADQIEDMTADFANARREAERAAERLANRVSIAVAAIQAADGVRDGAVPGDGSDPCPPSYQVKGDLTTMRYRNPGEPSYDQTVPDICFRSAVAAETAGFSESSLEGRVRLDAILVEDAVRKEIDPDLRPHRRRSPAVEDQP